MTPGRPIDVATDFTSAFVRRFAGRGASVLEIGGGDGDLAARLGADGYRVVMLDLAAEAVAFARANGVDAHCAAWPKFKSDPVDVILFTRSLHHMHDLDAAIEAAGARLAADGALLVEDFDFPAADAATAHWLQRRGLIADMSFPLAAESFLGSLIKAKDPMSAWRMDHSHEIHAYSELVRRIETQFGAVAAETAPYLFRYLISALPPDGDAAAFVRAAFDEELEHIKAGLIIPVGRRIVASF